MKLLEMKTGQAMDLMLKLSRLISNITKDKDLIDPIAQAIDVEKENLSVNGVRAKVLEQWSTFIYMILEKHSDEFCGILAELNGSTPDKISEQPVTETAAQINDIINDKDLLDFFSSVMRRGKKES